MTGLNNELNEKYARLWHETCVMTVPSGLEPFIAHSCLIKGNKGINDLYVSGLWKVLNMMAKDGLITQEELRRQHDEMNGWKPGSSTIQIFKRESGKGDD